ncbi:hypothetical protein B0H14DRAFT_2561983 [Mycena olivaceomarginata]|nr:hypothetical protein B0H14DRAFT_2561983 [Mycena olivaceomarginata]
MWAVSRDVGRLSFELRRDSEGYSSLEAISKAEGNCTTILSVDVVDDDKQGCWTAGHKVDHEKKASGEVYFELPYCISLPAPRCAPDYEGGPEGKGGDCLGTCLNLLGNGPMLNDIGMDGQRNYHWQIPVYVFLHSATLVCHTFHRVFTYNIVGPALPQALWLLRYPYPNDKACAAIDPIILATNCPEEHDTASLITAKEKILLQLDSELVEALENLYSSLPEFTDECLELGGILPLSPLNVSHYAGAILSCVPHNGILNPVLG